MITEIRLYLLDCESRNFSKRTIEINTFVLREFSKFVKIPLLEVTPNHVREYLAHKSATTSKATAKRYYQTISPFYAWCVNEGLLEINPVDKVTAPKAPRPMIEPLSKDEVTRLIAQTSGKTFADVRSRLILIMLVDCGLRVSELLDLDLDSLNLVDNVLTVKHGKGDKARMIPFGTTTAQILKQYLVKRGEQRSNALIVNCYGDRPKRDLPLKILWKLSDKAEIKRCHPHQLRHTFAVSYLRNGGDAFSLQRLLGHSTLEMTKSYCAIADSDLVAKHRLYSPIDNLQLQPEARTRIK